MDRVRRVESELESYGAAYRFGAPLDTRWLSAGWSAHLEFRYEGLRVRTDVAHTALGTRSSPSVTS